MRNNGWSAFLAVVPHLVRLLLSLEIDDQVLSKPLIEHTVSSHLDNIDLYACFRTQFFSLCQVGIARSLALIAADKSLDAADLADYLLPVAFTKMCLPASEKACRTLNHVLQQRLLMFHILPLLTPNLAPSCA